MEILPIFACGYAVAVQILFLLASHFDRVKRWSIILRWSPLIQAVVLFGIAAIMMSMTDDPTSRGYLGIGLVLVGSVVLIAGCGALACIALLWRVRA